MRLILPFVAVFALASCKTEPPSGADKPAAGSEAPKPAATKPGAGAPAGEAGAKRPTTHATPKTTALAEDEPAGFRTTSSRIYWLNLRGEVKALKGLVKKNPKNGVMWRKLASAQHKLGFLTGKLEHFAESIKSVDAAVEIDGGSFDNRVVRARSRQSLHNFSGALQDVGFVLGKRADHKGAKELRDAVHWSLGRYADGKAKLQTVAFSAKTTAQAGVGRQLFLSGQVEQARKAYAAAVAGFRGVNPATVAWLEVQRGVTYLDAGLYPQAERLFTAATKRLDEFTMAEEHLAEVLALQGKHAEAERLYGRVVKRSGDPTFRVALAGVLKAAGKAGEAKAELGRAREAFTARLKAFPAATWQEAAAFHLQLGELPRALELAEKNVQLRQDAMSLALLARVQAKAGEATKAGENISKALAGPIRSVGLFEAAHEVFTTAGKADEAAKWLAAAKALNPKAG